MHIELEQRYQNGIQRTSWWCIKEYFKKYKKEIR